MNDTIVRNQVLTKTYVVDDLLSGADIGTWQADYPLTALEFELIKNGKPITFNWANSILLISMGFGLNLVGKIISQIAGIEQTIPIGEWIALGVGVVASIILYTAGLALPNDRKKVMKSVKEQFKNAPKKRQVIRKEQ